MINFGRLLTGDYQIPTIPQTHCHRHNADEPPQNGLAQAAESNRRRGAATRAATRAAVLTAVHRGCSTIGDIAIDSGKAYSTVRRALKSLVEDRLVHIVNSRTAYSNLTYRPGPGGD